MVVTGYLGRWEYVVLLMDQGSSVGCKTEHR